MSTTTTLKFVVYGDSYAELRQKADAAIYKFLEVSDEDDEDDFELEDMLEEQPPLPKIDYELVVSESTDISSDNHYSAEVIARIKDVNR